MTGPTILGASVREPRGTRAAVVAVFVVLAVTGARTIGLFDEGELAVAAYELGLGHPVGQPLHTMLGFVFAHLPFVAPAHGLMLLSALAAALALVPTVALADRFLPEDARRFASIVAAATIALHPLLWEPSTRIEVYPLATLFGLLAVERASRPTIEPLRLGAMLGLSASANPVIAAFAFLIASVVAAPPATDRLRALGRLGLGLALGLLPYGYLGIAATREGAFVWGGLGSTDELAHYLLGRDYGGNLGVDWATRLAHARELLGYLLDDRAGLAILATAVLGLGALAIRSRRAAIAAVLGFVLPLAFVASNRVFAVDVPDYLGYLGLGWSLLAIPIAAAIDAAHARSRVGPVLVVALVGASIVAAPFALGRSRASDDVVDRLARAVLDEAPHRGILVLESDHLVAPILYLQRVERVRPDVVVVIHGLMASSWYLRLLHDQHPTLAGFAVRGPGGRDGRIRRLLDANADRPARVERLGLATGLGVVACPAGITFSVRARCDATDPLDLGPLLGVFRRAHRLPAGAIAGHQVVSAVGLRVALELERAGRNRDAYLVIVASLPDAYRGTFLPPPSVITDGRPLTTPDPSFRRARALGEPARNAFVAARMLADAGRIDPAIELVRRAMVDGLPEAEALLTRAAASR